jgi:hypothetical protein
LCLRIARYSDFVMPLHLFLGYLRLVKSVASFRGCDSVRSIAVGIIAFTSFRSRDLMSCDSTSLD